MHHLGQYRVGHPLFSPRCYSAHANESLTLIIFTLQSTVSLNQPNLILRPRIVIKFMRVEVEHQSLALL